MDTDDDAELAEDVTETDSTAFDVESGGATSGKEGASQAMNGDSGTAGDSGAHSSEVAGEVSGSDKGSTSSTSYPSNGGEGASGDNRVWHEPWDEWVSEGHWETTSVHHDEKSYEGPVYGAKCDCGFMTSVPDTLYAHLDEMGHRGYVTGVQVGTKTYIIPAWDEEVRTWVDTSHWVHHEGYWE
jgi:hypothetical protein